MSVNQEKENQNQLETIYYYGLFNLCPRKQQFLTQLESSFDLLQIKETKFKNLPSYYKAAAVLLVTFLEQTVPELENQTLNSLLSLVLPVEHRCVHLKQLFQLVRNLEEIRKNTIPFFQDIHNLFGFYSLIFLQMQKLQKEHPRFLTNFVFRKIWILFVFLSQSFKLESELSFIILLESITAIMHLLYQQSIKENFDDFKNSLKDFGFQLSDEELTIYSEKIQRFIPDFNDAFLEEDIYEEQYLQILQKYDLNMLVFLNDQQPKGIKSITLTPVLNNHSKCNSQKFLMNKKFLSNNLNQISFVSNFKEIISVIQAPEKQLHTPNLKKQLLENKNKYQELPKMYQWFKDILHDVEMISLVIEGVKYQVSRECSEFLHMKQIRENYKQVLLITKKIQIQENDQVFKLFFALFSQFMQKEIQISDQDIVNTLFKDCAFLKSLFCFALEINSLINVQNSMTTKQLVETCQTTYYNFWIILFHFAQLLGKSLPIIIRSRIVELECEILLKLIWEKKEDKKTEAEGIFSQDNAQVAQIIKKLLNILAERIYLITNEFQIQDEIKEKIWNLMKFFIFRGEAFNNSLSLITDTHLDVILILSIYQVTFVNKIYQTQISAILQVYKDKVLFPINVQKQFLLTYFKDEFKQELIRNQYDVDQMVVSSNKLFQGENPNSTPIHSQLNLKKPKIIQTILSSPLIDNLKIGLKKKNIVQTNTSLNLMNQDFTSPFSNSKLTELDLSFKSPSGPSKASVQSLFKINPINFPIKETNNQNEKRNLDIELPTSEIKDKKQIQQSGHCTPEW